MTSRTPRSIQADNGREFSNQILRKYHAQLNISIVHDGRPKIPLAQGQVERVTQTIKCWFAKKICEKRWIDYYSVSCISIQYHDTSRHESITLLSLS